MHAFHTNWTKPFFARHPGEAYTIEPFELLTTALSARLWQRENGSIALYCDSHAAAYYDQCGLSGLWDGGIHTVLDAVDAEIDPTCFWAAGKLYALRSACTPCVMIDTDFIVWQDLSAVWSRSRLCTVHREALMPDIYPDANAFHLHKPFSLNTLDWTVPAANTALAYFGDAAFTKRYADTAIHFMRAASPADNALTYMVFAEQRLLPMLARDAGLRLDSFSDLGTLFTTGQTWFTHVWGFKQQMREHPALYTDFCRRCAARLTRDFPEDAVRFSRLPALAPYFCP